MNTETEEKTTSPSSLTPTSDDEMKEEKNNENGENASISPVASSSAMSSNSDDDDDSSYNDRAEIPFSIMTHLLLPDDQHLHLPHPNFYNYHFIDMYLGVTPSLQNTTKNLFYQGVKDFSLEKNSHDVRVLNILQGEIAHCSSSSSHQKTDIMVSDDATTCHILAIRSSKEGKEENNDDKAMTSLAHIDRSCYENCIRKLIQKHYDFHQKSYLSDATKEKESSQARNIVELEIHMMGGFTDEDESSRKISRFLIILLANLAYEYEGVLKMKLVTCAISSINHDASKKAPIGRGFGINVSNGDVFLASVDGEDFDNNNTKNEVGGPALLLRHARLWSQARKKVLYPLYDDTSSSPNEQGKIIIQPFEFRKREWLDEIIHEPDDVLLLQTSTSPHCEKSNYCDQIRQTHFFMKSQKWEDIFGSECDHSLIYQRHESKANQWELVSGRPPKKIEQKDDGDSSSTDTSAFGSIRQLFFSSK